MSTDPPETYTKIWLSDLFHGFPHFNFHFSRVNSTFDPDKEEYQQALASWVLVPIAVCFLLWLMFLFYFIFRCCQSQNRPKEPPSLCLKIFTVLLILLGIGLVAFGFYENENAHDGVDDVRRAMDDANTTISTALDRIDVLDNLADDAATRLADELEHAILRIGNLTIQGKAIKLIKQIRAEAKGVQDDLVAIHIQHYHTFFKTAVDTSEEVEYYRWMVTVVVYCLFMFLFVASLMGMIMRSKGFLIVSASLGVVCSIFMWTASGAYLGSSTALGDLCVDPDSYFISLAEGSSSEVAVTAYIKCVDQSQPYQQDILKTQTAVTQAVTKLNETVKLAEPFHIPGLDRPVKELREDLQYAMGNLSALLNSVGMCSGLHHDYITAVDAACTDTITASALLALTSTLIGVCCTLVIFTMSCVWRQSDRKRVRAAYVPVDDTDPFLPRPPPYEHDYGTMGHSSPRPWSERGTLQHASAVNNEDQVMMLTHNQAPIDDSPPPAYHPGQYMRQYVDSGPTPNSVRGDT